MTYFQDKVGLKLYSLSDFSFFGGRWGSGAWLGDGAVDSNWIDGD